MRLLRKGFRWKREPTFLVLLAYEVVSANLAWLADLQTPHDEGTWGSLIILLMLIVLTACMITERGLWSIWKRIGFVFVGWIAQAILALPAYLIVGRWSPHGFQHVVTMFIASLPVVVFAMAQSRLFTQADILQTEQTLTLGDATKRAFKLLATDNKPADNRSGRGKGEDASESTVQAQQLDNEGSDKQ